jgi:acyl-CoA synthetase (AMP-forming)/AMP-acid ligase II
VEPGSKVGWSLDNERGGEALILYHAILKAGGVNVPVNPRLGWPTVAERFTHSGCALAVVASDLDTGSARNASMEILSIDDIDLQARVLATEMALPSPSEDDVASILYTSGTTGLPKGIEHTHASSIAAGIAWSDCFCLTPSDKLQSPFPVTSGAGLHYNGLSCLWAGATFVVDTADVERAIGIASQGGTTVYAAVPSIYESWLEAAPSSGADLSSLRIAAFGGAAIAPTRIDELRKVLPQAGLVQTYGFTEAGPGGTYLASPYASSRTGSIGNRPAGRFTSVRVVDEHGHDVASDEVGELLLSGPSLMRGYHRDPEATAAVLQGGWVRSGDLVRFDAEGFLHFVDRKKDIVVRGGYNISSSEVEGVLCSHPMVREAAVFGAAHDRLGEEVVAAIVFKTGVHASRALEDDVTRYCREHLPKFKVPARLYVLDRLPRNATGKVLKNDLRALAAGDR